MSFSTEMLIRMLRIGKILKIDNENHQLSIIPSDEVKNSKDVRIVFTLEELIEVFEGAILKKTIMSILKDKMPFLKI